MDQFLAEYYNTLGSGDMVKEGMFPPTGDDIAEAMGGTGTVPRRRRALRGKDPGRKLPAAESAPERIKKKMVHGGYDEPIGPPRPSRSRRRGLRKKDPGRKLPASESSPERLKRKMVMGDHDAPLGPPHGKTQYNRPIGPPPPKSSASKPVAAAAEEAAPGFLKRMGTRWKGLSRAGKAGIIAGAAAPVVAGGGYAAYRAMKNREKRSSDAAFDQLVEERAFGILYENGLADDYGNVVPPDEFEYEKTAGDFDSIVDSAALELLEANGYPVEWD